MADNKLTDESFRRLEARVHYLEERMDSRENLDSLFEKLKDLRDLRTEHLKLLLKEKLER
jgi:hypothetical protein